MPLTINVLGEQDNESNYHCSAFIRLLSPLGHPSLSKEVNLVASLELAPIRANVVIVERSWKPSLCEQDAIELVSEVKRRGSTFIYTLDDNLLDLGLDEEGESVPEEKIRIMRHFIKSADGVIVSTPALARRIMLLNSKVVVVPNALDERLFKPNAVNDGHPINRQSVCDLSESKIIIGYMGTLTHTYDLFMILEPLRKLLFRYGDIVKFEVIGVSTRQQIIKKILGSNVDFLEPAGGANYENFVNWFRANAHWDFGLAPLSSRPFNLYKSDLKYLDYGVLGIPGVFSNVGPYAETIRHGITGLLVENNEEDWFGAMESLILDRELRRRLGSNAFEEVVTKRMLDSRAFDWLSAIEDIRLHKNNLQA